MKKLTLICLAVLIGLGVSALSFAGDEKDITENKTVSVTINVPDYFGFKVWDDELSRTIIPGADDITITDPTTQAERKVSQSIGEVHIVPFANRGTPWQITARPDPEGFFHPTTFATISLEMQALKGGGAIKSKGECFIITLDEHNAGDQPVYKCHEDEVDMLGDYDIPLQYYAKGAPRAGIYTGHIHLTMSP